MVTRFGDRQSGKVIQRGSPTDDMEFDDAFPLQFYINLNRRDDRRRTVLNMFLDHGMEHVERFPAIDARTVRHCRGHWSEGRYALSLTQKLCLREAKRRKASAVMIFEDDVVLHPEFLARFAALEIPEDWGMLYLGTQHTSEPEWVSPGVVRVAHGLDTHAFAVKAEYYDRVMRVLSPQGKRVTREVKPSDWLLAALHREIPTYAAFPNLAWQGQEAVSDLMGKRNGTYDVKGFQRCNREYIAPVMRRHLGVTHWRGGVVDDGTEHGVGNAAAGSPAVEGMRDGRVAFLFLTRGLPGHLEMWSEYFRGHEDRVSVFAHPKEEVPSDATPAWWQEAVLKEKTETEWGDVSLVRAQRLLLEAALRDPANRAFVFLSESCVPIKPLSGLLTHLDRSGWRSMVETERWADVEKTNPKKAARLHEVPDVPEDAWRFHPQWMLLNREMAEAVMSADLTERWSKSFAPDESLFGTQLCLMGCPVEDEALPMSSTWTRWPERHQGHPETFHRVNDRTLGELLACPHFFARKFSLDSNIRELGLHLR